MNHPRKTDRQPALRVLPLGLRRSENACDFNLQELVNRMYPQLRGLLRDNIELRLTEPVDRACMIHGDPLRMHELIVHLALDAQDAMGAGGVVEIAVRCAADTPGAYVVLAFHETPRAEREARREVDKGRTLGLAAGYEAIERSGGAINVIRRDGATITQISLPRVESPAAVHGGTPTETAPPGGGMSG